MIFYNIELLNKRNETKHPKENTLLLLGEKKTLLTTRGCVLLMIIIFPNSSAIFQHHTNIILRWRNTKQFILSFYLYIV